MLSVHLNGHVILLVSCFSNIIPIVLMNKSGSSKRCYMIWYFAVNLYTIINYCFFYYCPITEKNQTIVSYNILKVKSVYYTSCGLKITLNILILALNMNMQLLYNAPYGNFSCWSNLTTKLVLNIRQQNFPTY